ncbi:MAG: hypothetical protein ACLTW9_28610 [Enterocloster sp.]
MMDGNEKAVKEAARKFQCRACTDIEELMALKPDYVVEAATAEAGKDICYGRCFHKEQSSYACPSEHFMMKNLEN